METFDLTLQQTIFLLKKKHSTFFLEIALFEIDLT